MTEQQIAEWETIILNLKNLLLVYHTAAVNEPCVFSASFLEEMRRTLGRWEYRLERERELMLERKNGQKVWNI